MYVLRIEGPCPAPGATLVTADGQPAGEVVDAVADHDGGSLATAVIQLTHRQAELRLNDGGARTMVLSGPDA